ncbi:6030_t:CDS:1, partial [Ambispora leptoticha]
PIHKLKRDIDTGITADSPGVVSGNNVQVPVHIPVNACGDNNSVIGLLAQFSEECKNN